MSKMAKSVTESRTKEKLRAETNFMGGISYGLDPVETMKMVTASSIFGEPQYYRKGEFVDGHKLTDKNYEIHSLFSAYSVLPDNKFKGKKTSEVMEIVINDALSADFEATIRWAQTLRTEYLMRLNPQVIMVLAAQHPNRVEFNKKNPGLFSTINAQVMKRADEPASQLTYWLYKNGKKNSIPNILKRNWAAKLESLNRYQMAKYKNTGIGMIDVVRISHAHSELIDELMKTGTVTFNEQDKTWEVMRSEKKSWKEIFESGALQHMALLRNLRGIFTEVEDLEFCKRVMKNLKNGVLKGKQFPFRYWSAYKTIENSNVNHKGILLDTLEECIDIACNNMPKLKGKTMCLSDNSGSAWGAFTSEYGSVTVAEIDNLSSLITARNSDEGFVGKFGDKLITKPISKRNGILSQLESLTNKGCSDVGGSTENGIWLFFKNAIKNNEWWDNIFIYSDQQAGHGGLYGTSAGIEAYTKAGYGCSGSYGSERYVDVAKLINAYRQKVNPKVNVFSVQTAGYTNAVIPEYGYRTNIMYGWTGKELIFADSIIKLWDEHDQRK